MGDQFRAALLLVQEQVHAGVAVQDGESQRERRVRHIAAPHVEQPANRIRQGNDRGIGAGFFQVFRQPGALGRAGLAGQVEGMGNGGVLRRWRLAGPYRVNGIAVAGHQRAARPFRCRPQARHRIGGGQPGVVTQLGAARQVIGNPALRSFRHQIARLEQFGVGLGAHLQRVAPIGEHHGLVHQHHRRPRRAGESRQPGQPFGARRQIFALVFVGMGNDKTVQPALAQFGAQRLDAGRALRCIADVIIGLEGAVLVHGGKVILGSIASQG